MKIPLTFCLASLAASFATFLAARKACSSAISSGVRSGFALIAFTLSWIGKKVHVALSSKIIIICGKIE